MHTAHRWADVRRIEEIGHEDVGAELPQLGGGLQRRDSADQEEDEGDDGQSLGADDDGLLDKGSAPHPRASEEADDRGAGEVGHEKEKGREPHPEELQAAAKTLQRAIAIR